MVPNEDNPFSSDLMVQIRVKAFSEHNYHIQASSRITFGFLLRLMCKADNLPHSYYRLRYVDQETGEGYYPCKKHTLERWGLGMCPDAVHQLEVVYDARLENY